MNYFLSNIEWINNKKIQFIILSWACIEILQKTKYASNYFVMHLSSFFGALIFLYLIDFYKKSKCLKVTPIIVEIFHSLYFQGVVDIEDILFSLSGIMFYYFIFQKNKKIINKKWRQNTL